MPHGLAITPDGSRVLVAGFGTDQVEAIDTSTNQH
jgi:YVTN family beta-propeller protein